MPKVTEQQETEAQARVVSLLNEVESILGGWVLGYDKEQVSKLVDPLYTMCDQESPARKATREFEEGVA